MNPFLTYGYESTEYFCDRVEETKRLTTLLVNGNHVALISPRRMGKTGLISHCFAQKSLSDNYYCFAVDIYSTKSLEELVYTLGKSILGTLKSRGKQVWELFISCVSSFRTGISMDDFGNPSWNLELGDIKSPQVSLDEIFSYLSKADKQCIVAIDEFQAIAEYPEKNVEALLRTYIQHCRNAVFVFSGSKRSMMGEIFNSPSRPFYQSASGLSLKPIPLNTYTEFIKSHFEKSNRSIAEDAITYIYNKFDGTTWYIQKVCNELYANSMPGDNVLLEDVEPAIRRIIGENEEIYKDLLCKLTTKQKAVLIAINKTSNRSQITSSEFIKKNKLASASSVQKAVAALVGKQIVICQQGVYMLYDYFFAEWMIG